VKNIVICADGTGNTTIKGRGTNVFKLYEAVDQSGHRLTPGPPPLTPQVALYHDGVGTESLKWLRIVTGATGWGLSRNVKQLWGELARVYAPGDKIFLLRIVNINTLRHRPPRGPRPHDKIAHTQTLAAQEPMPQPRTSRASALRCGPEGSHPIAGPLARWMSAAAD
jgi:hypothetical protein